MTLSKRPEERGWRGGEDGIALFMAMMFLVLLGSFALIMLQHAGTEKRIGGYVKREATSIALAEAGVEQVLSWFADPRLAPEPHRNFFQNSSCPEDTYTLEEELTGMGVKATTTLSASLRKDGSCTMTVHTEQGKGVQVDLAKNPMPTIIAPVLQGIGNRSPRPGTTNINIPDSTGDRFIHDDQIGYFTGVPSMDKIKSFVRRFGHYFPVAHNDQGDCLEVQEREGGCESFDTLFALKEGSMDKTETYHLVLIDNENPFSILPGAYKGYFYFTGDITIEGVGAGKPSQAPAYTSMNLDGLLYTPQKITFGHSFYVHGAVYAGLGFGWEGDCQRNSPCLTVWYNDKFGQADYPGVAPMIRLPGTWRTM